MSLIGIEQCESTRVGADIKRCGGSSTLRQMGVSIMNKTAISNDRSRAYHGGNLRENKAQDRERI